MQTLYIIIYNVCINIMRLNFG